MGDVEILVATKKGRAIGRLLSKVKGQSSKDDSFMEIRSGRGQLDMP
jgi:hypothetical protein